MKEFTTIEKLLKPLTPKLLATAEERYAADYYCKRFKLRDQLVALLYGQWQGLKSLRELEIAFNSQKMLHRRLGCQEVRRTTLSDANARRTASVFLWIAEQLMSVLPRKKRREVNRMVRKLDSSPLQLKGRGFDEWTRATKTLRCQGVKLHTEYDGEVGMATRFKVSAANVDDSRMGQCWPLVEDTVYVFDKGYYDFNWWWRIEQKGAFFVTRLKTNAAVVVEKSLPVKSEGILEDSEIRFKNKNPRGGKRNHYAKPLRRVVVRREGKAPLVLVTNLLTVSAEYIAELYKERWEIEIYQPYCLHKNKVKINAPFSPGNDRSIAWVDSLKLVNA